MRAGSFHTEICNVRLFQSPPRARSRTGAVPAARPYAALRPLPRLGPRCPHLSPHLALALAAVLLLVFPGTYLGASFQASVSLARKGSDSSTRAAGAQSPATRRVCIIPGSAELVSGGKRLHLVFFFCGVGFFSPFSLLGGAKASEVLIAVCPCSASARPPPRRSQPFDPPALTPRHTRLVPLRLRLRGSINTRPLPPPFPALGTNAGISRPAGPAGRLPLARGAALPASPSPAWGRGRWQPQGGPYTRGAGGLGCRLSRCKLWSVGRAPGFEEENLFPL